jgi:hypothetical protein
MGNAGGGGASAADKSDAARAFQSELSSRATSSSSRTMTSGRDLARGHKIGRNIASTVSAKPIGTRTREEGQDSQEARTNGKDQKEKAGSSGSER